MSSEIKKIIAIDIISQSQNLNSFTMKYSKFSRRLQNALTLFKYTHMKVLYMQN